ncbi:hypothetical protein Tco_0440787, partial [Tanacetum coccineum]
EEEEDGGSVVSGGGGGEVTSGGLVCFCLIIPGDNPRRHVAGE